MGIKRFKQSLRNAYDLDMGFHGDTLHISIKSNLARWKDTPIVFMINDAPEVIHMDANGEAKVIFDKSDPPVLYTVKVQNTIDLVKDQRLAFWY